jgi:LysM repeat protein
MRPQILHLVVATLAFALVTGGCGKKRKMDTSAESGDGISQADTANIDAAGGVEALPTIDQGDAGKGSGKNRNDDASVSGEGGAGSMADMAPPPAVKGTGQMTNYAVQKGDTLMKIAFNIYGDIAQWKNLYEWNKDKLKSANALEVGDQLKYDKPASEPAIEKNGEPYMIKKGDTLGLIAGDVYGKQSKWKKLWENNRSLIHDPNRIYAGFYLYYQITEEEKREAEEIKAKRGGGGLGQAQMGGGGMGQAQVGGGNAAPVAAAGKDALKSGGLNNLATPPPNRVPAQQQQKQ